MATSPSLESRPTHRHPEATELVRVLSVPLPNLPPGDVVSVAAELRAMETDRAVAVWRHPGWAGVVGWIIKTSPECDPTVAAIHAIRRAPAARNCSAEAVRLSDFLRRTAWRSPADQWPRRTELLTFDLPAHPASPEHPSTESLSADARQLLTAAGIMPGRSTWQLISVSLDIAVDWWVGLAAQTGAAGQALLQAARSSDRVNGRLRLRNRFDGPTARPLVALLVGGDQWGRRAREAAGVEVGLVYWAVVSRRAQALGQAAPVPPAVVVRAWATAIGFIERAARPNSTGGQEFGPTVAA